MKNIIKRTAIMVLYVLILFTLSACCNMSPGENPSERVEQTESPGGAVADVDNSSILGDWPIAYAKHANTGEDYPLQDLYGTGIKYGGKLTLFADGTFCRYIGITTGETEHYEGTYQFSGDEITFHFYDGEVSTAKYLPLDHELEYHTKDSMQTPVNEYYIKGEH